MKRSLQAFKSLILPEKQISKGLKDLTRALMAERISGLFELGCGQVRRKFSKLYSCGYAIFIVFFYWLFI